LEAEAVCVTVFVFDSVGSELYELDGELVELIETLSVTDEVWDTVNVTEEDTVDEALSE